MLLLLSQLSFLVSAICGLHLSLRLINGSASSRDAASWHGAIGGLSVLLLLHYSRNDGLTGWNIATLSASVLVIASGYHLALYRRLGVLPRSARHLAHILCAGAVLFLLVEVSGGKQ